VIEPVLYETLCLYPTVPGFARQCIKEHIISTANSELKIHVPVDAMIVVNNYILHRREDYWSRLLEFDYNRWMRDPVTYLKSKLSHSFAYLPLDAGSRNCIGENFALLEAKVILAMFVQRCELKSVPGQTIVPEMKDVSMPTKCGLFVHLKKRTV
jgi:cytochrome P450